MSAVINPTTVTVTDAEVSAQSVTSVALLVGTATGGPYTASKATVPIASFTAGAGGTYAVPFANVTFAPALVPFTSYFMVAEADNAQGASGNSPEVTFSVVSAPTAPTGLSLS